jgi:hypothetical protein
VSNIVSRLFIAAKTAGSKAFTAAIALLYCRLSKASDEDILTLSFYRAIITADLQTEVAGFLIRLRVAAICNGMTQS